MKECSCLCHEKKIRKISHVGFVIISILKWRMTNMTQQELLKEMEALGLTNFAVAEKILHLINHHVADVIGEDEEIPDDAGPRHWPDFYRNELRAKQRKRGGL